MTQHPALAAGRTAVITGAASGVGLAAAHRFASLGMNLVLADLPGKTLDAAVAGIDGVQAMACPTDVADAAQVQRLKETAYARFGEVAVLMNNAGVGQGGGAFANPDGWRKVLGINLWGVIHGVQAFAQAMLDQKTPAAIVNTGSKQGITTPPGDTAYNVSKAGVKVLTEGLQHELRNVEGSQVDAYLLVPGFTYTGLTRAASKPAAAWTSEQVVDELLAAMAERRFYVICPDNDVSPETDRKRIRWAAEDVAQARPPLSRWHPDYKVAFARYMAEPE